MTKKEKEYLNIIEKFTYLRNLEPKEINEMVKVMEIRDDLTREGLLLTIAQLHIELIRINKRIKGITNDIKEITT